MGQLFSVRRPRQKPIPNEIRESFLKKMKGCRETHEGASLSLFVGGVKRGQ